MKAILIKDFGGPEQLYISEVDKPVFSKNEILVKVKASALNRADTLQRKGLYPPPNGASDILGLEMSGVVKEIGPDVKKWKVGDRVCGLLSGGGYAEYVSIHENLAIDIPGNLNFQEAAAIPEVFLTAFQAIFYLGQFKEGESILIHAGASGVGTAAIQLARSLHANKIIVTASKGKHDLCKELGAHNAIDYKSQDFEKEINHLTQGKGVDVIIDFLAASYLQMNINSLGLDGRMVLLALMGGMKVDDLNIGNILRKRLQIMGSTLRARSMQYKVRLTRDFVNYSMPLFRSGELVPVIDSLYDWNDVSAAHEYMESNQNKGKIILNIRD